MISAVLFDYGGLFVPDIYNAALSVELHGVNSDRQKEFRQFELLANQGKVNPVEIFRYFKDFFKSDFLNNLDAQVGDLYKRPDINLIDLVKKLKQKGLKAGLVSNNFPMWIAKLKEQDYLRQFDTTIFSADVGIVKPDKEIYLAAVKRVGTYPSQTLFVDDRSENVAGAKIAGLEAVQYKGYAILKTDLNKFGVAL